MKIILIFFLIMLHQAGYCQYSVLDKSGRKPNWVEWSRGRDFVEVEKSREFNIKETSYLLVVHTSEPITFTLDDVRTLNQLHAGLDFFSKLNLEIENKQLSEGIHKRIEIIKSDAPFLQARLERSVTRMGEKEVEVFMRNEKLTIPLRFFGVKQLDEYWEKVKDNESSKEYLQLYILYSISKSEFENWKEQLIEGKFDSLRLGN